MLPKIRSSLGPLIASNPLPYINLAYTTSKTFLRLQPRKNLRSEILSPDTPKDIREAVKGLDKLYDDCSLSYHDLYTLASTIAVASIGGPSLSWQPGRSDTLSTPPPALPNSRGASELRKSFASLGLPSDLIPTLSSTHSLHRLSSSPTISNAYFKTLEQYYQKFGSPSPDSWTPRLYTSQSHTLRLTPCDLTLLHDRSFRALVIAYAKDENLFMKDFKNAFEALINVGLPAEPV